MASVWLKCSGCRDHELTSIGVFGGVWHRPPDVTVNLSWIYGYKCRGARKTIAYTHTHEIAYPAATVGVLYSRERNTQAYLMGHTDEITAIAVHAEVRVFGVSVRLSLGGVYELTRA